MKFRRRGLSTGRSTDILQMQKFTDTHHVLSYAKSGSRGGQAHPGSEFFFTG